MNLSILLISLLILFAVELLYFKIANNFNIIDKPNHRSSHTVITIRGGGVIFSIALLFAGAYWGFQYEYFLIGLLLISFISFVDDVKPASNIIRILFHLAAVALLFYQVSMYNQRMYFIILGLFLVIGSINAINFMDGINGLTGSYSLITLITFYYINRYVTVFTNENYLTISILSLIVFNFFNFRIKAKCFAGDVGSVSLAFIILFFLLQLIIKTSNLNYLLMLLVYGLDTVTTITFRAYRKENIFKAHRSHFYQFWANEKKVPHLLVSMAYGIVQGVINFILIRFNPTSVINLILSVAITAIIFILIRIRFEGSGKLFNLKKND
ncbi:MraY family glycosyltransferase [Mucilaginibacter sp. UYCu711]|uniref:MraY family glycosyltransferase n=1 Tax=Mucilaginibacter sp. UYCu711 TaxID=3156339 RepID=UPI003D1E1699